MFRMGAPLVIVFRSVARGACDERAFVLSALNIPSEVLPGSAGFELAVAPAQSALAAHHLWQYEQELRQRAAPAPVLPPAPPPRPHAWVGSALYVALLVLVAMAVVQGWWRAELFTLGDLDSARVRDGQWWRAITALTLHLDIVHLVSNLGAGAAVGYFASRQMGAGLAWLLIVVSAAASNLIEGWLGAGSHRSVGASTAVFAGLGLLAAHAWRRRRHLPARWAWRWSPLVVGVVLLGLLGSAGEGTNLVAHAFGFVLGIGAGFVAAGPALQPLQRAPQWLPGALALALPLGAWWFAVSG